ncbi:uncharacterized protein LOC122509607 [Leptopilina heterotoma]|uniref:uncharacterized protein LOC122509607 n=1 Tax=Leptopilina heterotoma TaxID=63436 RepID=UPI001CA89355|nr:uncharacterized protein LOC122509607 [Leptopilina heterotoma]
MVQCVVKNCENKLTRSKQRKRTGITYHRFPKDPFLRKQWARALQLGKDVILNNQRVCSKHFLKHDIDKSISSRIRVKKNAIPFLSSFYACEIKKEVDNDSQVSESEEEKFSPFSPKKLHNLDAFITSVECDGTLKRSPSLIFDSPYKSFLEISVVRKEDEVTNENKFRLRPEKFNDRGTSLSPQKEITIPKVELNQDSCEEKNNYHKNNVIADKLTEKLRLASLNIMTMEKDINSLRQEINKLQKSVSEYTMTVKIY